MGITASAAVTSTGDVYWNKDFWNSPNYPFNVDNIGTGSSYVYIDNATGQLTTDRFTNGKLNALATDPNGNLIGGFWFDKVTDQYGTSIEYNAKQLAPTTLKSINSEAKVRDILKGAGYDVKDNWDLVPVSAFDLALDEAIDSDGAYAWFDAEELFENPAGYAAGQTVYFLRETYSNQGEWEVVEATLEECDGRLQARVKMTARDQALVAIRVMEDGRTVRMINKKTGASVVVPADKVVSNGTSTSAAATASPQASPKTGEF